MKKYWPFIILILFGIVPLLDFLHPGIPLTHDGKDHVARIANFYQNLSEGTIVPRWAANLNWGYGHPILMFLYPLPSYMGSFFHSLGFSFTDSVKLVFAAAYIASGIAMYFWIREFLDEYAGVIAGVLYMYAPYRFVDLHVRGAIGEHMAFVFPPLILLFLLKLSKLKKYSIESDKQFLFIVGLALSTAGLILSHNAITIMFLPFIAICFVYLFIVSKYNRGFLLSAGFGLILGFMLSSFFLIPAFLEGKYTLRDIVTKNEFAKHFVDPIRFLHGPWRFGGSGIFSIQLGIVHILGIILASVLLFKSKTEKWMKIFYGTVLFYFLFSLFLMISPSLFIYNIVTTLQKFQFPWRFLTVSVFTSSILASFALFLVKNKRWKVVLLLSVLISSVMFYSPFWRVQGYLENPESYYTSIYNGTTDTGESAPIWSVRFMEKRPKAKMEFISGRGEIKEIKRTSTYHSYEVSTTSSARLRENTLYFPGWNIFVDKNPVDIQFQDAQNRGIMTFNIEKGTHIIEVIFKETKLRYMANMVSILAIAIISVYGIVVFLKKQK